MVSPLWSTPERTQAWHLARGRLPTVLIDFAGADLDNRTPLTMTVGRVAAKYQTHSSVAAVGRLLTSADRTRLSD